MLSLAQLANKYAPLPFPPFLILTPTPLIIVLVRCSITIKCCPPCLIKRCHCTNTRTTRFVPAFYRSTPFPIDSLHWLPYPLLLRQVQSGSNNLSLQIVPLDKQYTSLLGCWSTLRSSFSYSSSQCTTVISSSSPSPHHQLAVQCLYSPPPSTIYL